MALAAILLARLLTVEEYGTIQQLLVLYLAASSMFGTGIAASTYYFLPRLEEEDKRSGVFLVMGTLACMGLAIGLVLYLAAEPIAGVLNAPEEFPALLRTFSPYLFFMLPVLAIDGVFLHRNRPVGLVSFHALTRTGILFALVIPAWLGLGLQTAVFWWLCVGAAQGVLAWILALAMSGQPGARGSRRPTLGQLRGILAYSIPLMGANIALLAATYVDKGSVSILFGTAAFAVYMNGIFENPVATVIYSSTQPVLLKSFASVGDRPSDEQREQSFALWHRVTNKQAAILFPMAAFLAVYAEDLVHVLFSPRYADSAPIFRVFAAVTALRALTPGSLFSGFGHNKAYLVIQIVAALLAVLAVLTGLEVFGLAGGPLGVITFLAVNVLLAAVYITPRVFGAGWRRFLDWRELGLLTGCSLLCLGLGSLVVAALESAGLFAWASSTAQAAFGEAGSVYGEPITRLIVGALVTGGAYMPVIWRRNYLQSELRMLLGGLLARRRA